MLATDHLLDLPCTGMWAALVAPGRSYLPALLQRFAALAGWQEAGPAGQGQQSLLCLNKPPERILLGVITRLEACCYGRSALRGIPEELRQQCISAVKAIRLQLLQLLGTAMGKARAEQAAGQAAAGGGAGLLLLRELLPLVSVAYHQQQTLTLAEVQQAGLQGLQDLLPLPADSAMAAHCAFLQLLHK